MFNNLKKSRPAFRLPELPTSSNMLLVVVPSSRYDAKRLLNKTFGSLVIAS